MLYGGSLLRDSVPLFVTDDILKFCPLWYGSRQSSHRRRQAVPVSARMREDGKPKPFTGPKDALVVPGIEAD